MTRKEAIFCEKSYIGETNCTDCKYYGTETCQSRESHRMAIKALEQEQKSEWEHDHEKLKAYSDGANEVLDKIRAEIKTMSGDIETIADVLAIIDKYKAENEG